MSHDAEKPPEPFVALELPHKDLSQLLVSRYRVYKNHKDFIVVDAHSALEALHASGMKEASRISRDILFFNNVLDLDTMMNNPVAPPPAAMESVPAINGELIIEKPAEEPEATAAIAEPEIATPAAVEAPLSNAEIDKLLQG